jgi:putative tryptophan/tyrosine transport system substrate-binding protein
VRRREFLPFFGAVIAARPFRTNAQPPKVPVVGLLSTAAPGIAAEWLAAWRKALAAAGFVEGRNLTVEYRWAEGKYDRLPGFAADLVDRKVDAIYTWALPSALAAKAATSTIPIVFNVGGDPIGFGLVERLSRPGGNLTGSASEFDWIWGKRLQLLYELVPTAGRIGLLINPENRNSASLEKEVGAAAQALGLNVKTLTVSKPDQYESAFTVGRQNGVDALLVGNDPVFSTKRQELLEAAARHRLPAMYYVRDFAVDGGLIGYGSSFEDAAYIGGTYVGRILKGEKPGDLPIQQPTKFELVINLKTAKALGLTVPPALLARADAVIE